MSERRKMDKIVHNVHCEMVRKQNKDRANYMTGYKTMKNSVKLSILCMRVCLSFVNFHNLHTVRIRTIRQPTFMSRGVSGSCNRVLFSRQIRSPHQRKSLRRITEARRRRRIGHARIRTIPQPTVYEPWCIRQLQRGSLLPTHTTSDFIICSSLH